MNHPNKIPRRYIPAGLTRKDAHKQRRMILQSRRQYKRGLLPAPAGAPANLCKQHRFQTRKRVASFRNRRSHHVRNARRMYGVNTISPTPELARATGCSVRALREIVRKGEGAYYSSGSRPNQTPQSWGLARLASAITSGKAAYVDRDILERGCTPKSRALQMLDS